MDNYLLIMQVSAKIPPSPSKREFPSTYLLPSNDLIIWFFFFFFPENSLFTCWLSSPNTHPQREREIWMQSTRVRACLFCSQSLPQYPLNQMEMPPGSIILSQDTLYLAFPLTHHTAFRQVLSTTIDCKFKKKMKCICPTHHYFWAT